MARPTQRRKTVREQPAQQGVAPPALQQNRRYFVAGGHDEGMRTARALENAFQVGTEFASDELDRRNEEGAKRALGERAKGVARDVDDENKGYMDTWDTITAEFDYNYATKELPEMLRGANWERMDEEQVQGFISEYMSGQFDKIQDMADSKYAQFLAPKLLELETELLGQHRDMVLENVREENRTMIVSNARVALQDARKVDPTALPNYDKLFKETGRMFDGAEKKVVFWETVYDLAIKAGDPSIIESVPVKVGDILTGIEDSKMLDSHRAAIKQAEGVQTARLKQKEDEQEAEYENRRFDLQMQIVEQARQGQPVDGLIDQLAAVPGAEFSEVSAATNFGQGQFANRETMSPNDNAIAGLWVKIHSGEASLSDLINAYNMDTFGTGKQAGDQLHKMANAIDAIRKAKSSGGGAEVTRYQSMINKNYNAQLEGPLGRFDQTMQAINVKANEKYLEYVNQDGLDPFVAYRRVTEEFDPMVTTNTPDGRSVRDHSREMGLVPLEVMKSSASDPKKFSEMMQTYTPAQIETRAQSLYSSQQMTLSELDALGILLEPYLP